MLLNLNVILGYLVNVAEFSRSSAGFTYDCTVQVLWWFMFIMHDDQVLASDLTERNGDVH